LTAANTEPATVACALAGYASCRVPVDGIASLRRQPGPPCGGEPWPANFLKHVDDQTVAGLAAVLRAIADHHLVPPGCPDPFRDWGVLATPRYLGRPLLTQALPRFQTEGAWGVSPHLIPHRSLHSISGTMSQALKIHGPNFGVGGGPGGELEALLAGVALLDHMNLPGVWIVFTQLVPDGHCDPATGRPAPDTEVCGLALALTPLAASPSSPVLELSIGRGRLEPAALSMDVLEEALAALATRPDAIVPLGGPGRLVMSRQPLPLQGPHASFLAPQAASSGPQGGVSSPGVIPERSDRDLATIQEIPERTRDRDLAPKNEAAASALTSPSHRSDQL
jgi:hypothetical protein